MNGQTGPEYLQTLSRYLCEAKLEAFPSHVVDRGRWVVADCLVLIAAGMQADGMKRFVKTHLTPGTRGRASVIGAARKANAMTAALLNGTAGTWLEFVEDNLHAKGHPGIQVVPVAIAIAEELELPGRDLLLAVIAGYEASSRISRATKIRFALHPHGTFGTIGAAVAVAKLTGYGPEAMRRIINIGATLGLATSRRGIIEGATVGRAYSGMSGYMGVLAHQLVQAGFTSEIDGVRSVYGSIYGDDPSVISRIPQAPNQSFDPDMVVAGLGEEFLILKNFFKLHACARSIHPALDLIGEVMAQRPGGRIDPDEVARIAFRSYASPATLSAKTVTTTLASKFSVPFAVASLIVNGRRSLENFEEAAVGNPVIQGLAQRVDIEENPAYTAHFPLKQPCDVRVTFKDGAVVEAKAEYTKGEPQNPATAAELTEKFFEVAGKVWKRTKAEAVLDGLMGLDRIGNVRAFLAQHRI